MSTSFGTQYLASATFTARANAFGCGAAISNMTPDEIDDILATASRMVDNYTNMVWAAGTITEIHSWNPSTFRIPVNNPPLSALSSFIVKYKPGNAASYTLTPVTTNSTTGDVTYGAVLYSVSGQFLELVNPNLSNAENLAGVIGGLYTYEPLVTITYTSTYSTPAAISSATGYIAAMLANEQAANNSLTPGIQSFKVDGVMVQRTPAKDKGMTDIIPVRAQMLLNNYVRTFQG